MKSILELTLGTDAMHAYVFEGPPKWRDYFMNVPYNCAPKEYQTRH